MQLLFAGDEGLDLEGGGGEGFLATTPPVGARGALLRFRLISSSRRSLRMVADGTVIVGMAAVRG
jgi:hypothetical protein